VVIKPLIKGCGAMITRDEMGFPLQVLLLLMVEEAKQSEAKQVAKCSGLLDDVLYDVFIRVVDTVHVNVHRNEVQYKKPNFSPSRYRV
jgi:hypothetical protein